MNEELARRAGGCGGGFGAGFRRLRFGHAGLVRAASVLGWAIAADRGA
jgi:hypothetical protein